jgi:hypothetical protein
VLIRKMRIINPSPCILMLYPQRSVYWGYRLEMHLLDRNT